jgi:lipoate-protein ligase A
MHLLDLTLPTAEENLALEEALLDLAEAGGAPAGILRLWESARPFVCLGSNGKVADDVDADACAADGVPVLRRVSGGGTVLQGPGCLNFTVILPYDRDPELRGIHGSYRYILGRVAAALGTGVEMLGGSDLTVGGGRKIGGNAQRRLSRVLLHHGTLLHGFDIAAMARYLREPPKRPDYRGARTHGEFAVNLALPGDEIRRRLIRVWEAAEPLPSWPASEVERLVRTKYSDPAWNLRR